MAKSVGGRGKKAPYETTHVRVPVTLKSQIDRLVQLYHETGSTEGTSPIRTLDEAIVIANSIVTHKKSARISLEKLLTSIYGEQVKL